MEFYRDVRLLCIENRWQKIEKINFEVHKFGKNKTRKQKCRKVKCETTLTLLSLCLYHQVYFLPRPHLTLLCNTCFFPNHFSSSSFFEIFIFWTSDAMLLYILFQINWEALSEVKCFRLWCLHCALERKGTFEWAFSFSCLQFVQALIRIILDDTNVPFVFFPLKHFLCFVEISLFCLWKESCRLQAV